MTSPLMKALILDSNNKSAFVQAIPRPVPQAGEVLIRVHVVALNPVDSLYVANPLGTTGRTVGSDFSGTILETTSSRLRPGQKVAGFLQGACSVNDRPGAFAEFLVCPEDLLWTIPDSMTLEEAATVSLCALTAAQGLFYRLGLKAPFDWAQDESPKRDDSLVGGTASFTFFVYGASTSVGMYAAQLVRWSAKATGAVIRLIGAASPAKFPVLQAEPYGYDVLVDYRDSLWPQQVVASTGGTGVDYAYDCISEGQTVKLVGSTLRDGGKIAVVRSKEGGAFDSQGLDTQPIYGAVWEGLGVGIQYHKMLVPASAEAREFATCFYRWLSGQHRLVANPIRLMPGGMERIVPDGFALLGSGSMTDRPQPRHEPWMKPISGEKLVYRITD
ncbi:hypothetical protein PV08_09824 [Exophiala spinifera]|uniref:Enoyl reductase (ER) domain-containing protein n=1 Tax=Exophiala spinifera TaxID=91928 RepID=A0A0D1ZI55_9EURO|nr:uncharacterized protein PV08_09824 [Exophiala spinifera]KIW12547.1 hypothetical protein PV08_09824 [Exophiala spinifera]